MKPDPEPRKFGHKRTNEIRKEKEVPGEEFAQIPLRGPEFWPNSSPILLFGRFSSENLVFADLKKFRVPGGA